MLGEESYWSSVEAACSKRDADRYEEETGNVWVDSDGYDREGYYWGLPDEDVTDD